MHDYSVHCVFSNNWPCGILTSLYCVLVKNISAIFGYKTRALSVGGLCLFLVSLFKSEFKDI